MVQRQIFILPYEIPKHSTQEIHKSHRALDPNLADISTTSSQFCRNQFRIFYGKFNFSKIFLQLCFFMLNGTYIIISIYNLAGSAHKISNLGDALRVYHHHKFSANSSDPSVWPIPVSLAMILPTTFVCHLLCPQAFNFLLKLAKTSRSQIFCSDERCPYKF